MDEVRDEIEKTLRYRKSAEVTKQHVKQLRDKTKIEILLKPLPPSASTLNSPATMDAPAVKAPNP